MPGAFQFELAYDHALNECKPSTDTALDGNPDANLGAATFGGSQPVTVNGLGIGWNCSPGGIFPPTCSNLSNNAFIACVSPGGTAELPVGQGVSEPIAVVTFAAVAGGVDNLTLASVDVEDPDVQTYISCFGSDEDIGECIGGTDIKIGSPPPPTATQTPTASPTPTRVICGISEIPPARLRRLQGRPERPRRRARRQEPRFPRA